MSSGSLCSCFQWSNCILTASLSHKSYKRIESRMNPSPDHHLVLVAIQVAPDLCSFRDNQTQWGHTHCCLFLETNSDASFASCLAALVIRGLDIDPTSTLIIQLPRVAWPGDIFSTCFCWCAWFFLLWKQNSFIMTLFLSSFVRIAFSLFFSDLALFPCY